MKHEDKPIAFECSCIVNDEIWFSARDFNGLFRGKLESGELEFVCFFPKEDLRERRMHSAAVECGTKLIFAPGSGKYIHVYDRVKGVMEMHAVRDIKEWKYGNVYAWKDKVFIFPAFANEILKYNVSTGCMVGIKGNKTKEWTGVSIANQNKVFLTEAKETKELMVFDMDTETMEIIPIGDKLEYFRIMGIYKGYLYLYMKNTSEIAFYDILEKKIVTRKVFAATPIGTMTQAKDMVIWNSKMGEGIQTMNMNTLISSTEKKTLSKSTLEQYEIIHSFIHKNDLLYVWGGDLGIYSVSHSNKIYFRKNERVIRQMRNAILLSNDRKYFIEGEEFTIRDYVQFLKERREC